MVRLVPRSLFANHAGHCRGGSLISFVIPKGNWLNLTRDVFLPSELTMTNAFRRKTHPFSGTVFFLCYCASAHSPTPLLRTVCGSIAVYSVFLLSQLHNTFSMFRGELLSLHFYRTDPANFIFRLMSAEGLLFVKICTRRAMTSHFLLFFFRKIFLS